MTQNMTQRIGFIGIGLMGHGMAKNLVSKGFPLTFKANRNRSNLADLVAAGAAEAKTNAAAGEASDIVFICVTGSPQVEDVVYGDSGLLSAARKGLVVVDCSTAEPASSAKIRADFAAKGTCFIDAPLARTPVEAESGKLNIMVGAEQADFDALKPVLQAFCENIIHVGPPGTGHVLKLVNNFLAMTIAASTAEAFAAAAKSGLPLQKLYEVISAGGVNSGVFQMIAAKAMTGDFTGLKFSIANGQKDLRYYTHMTEMLPVTSFLAEAVHQTLLAANNLGFGDKYVASLIEAQEKINNIKIVSR